MFETSRSWAADMIRHNKALSLTRSMFISPKPTVDITLSQVKMMTDMTGEFIWFLLRWGEDRDGKIEGGHIPLSDRNRLLEIQSSQRSNCHQNIPKSSTRRSGAISLRVHRVCLQCSRIVRQINAHLVADGTRETVVTGAVLAVYCQYLRSLLVGLMLKPYNAIVNLSGFVWTTWSGWKEP